MTEGRLRYATIAIALALLLTAAFAFQQRITLPGGQEATIDWGTRELTAVGQAVPPSNAETEGQKRLLARRGAILDAQRNLLETLSNVNVTSDSTMVNLMASDVVRSQVEGLIQGAIVTNEAWDGDVEIYTVEMLIPLYEPPDESGDVDPPPPPPEHEPTGLVLDLRELNAVPALTFRIFTRSGVEVTPSARAFYVTALPGGLGSPVEDAMADERVADDPFLVRAVGLRENRIDVVIDDADGQRLRRYLSQRNYFQEGRALVVMN